MDQMIEVTLCIYFPTRLDVTEHIVHGMFILEYIIIYFLYFFFRFLLTIAMFCVIILNAEWILG